MDAVSVTELSPGLKDREVLDLAGREGRIVVAFDKDFGELVVRESKGANPAEVRAKVPAAGSREDLAGTEVGNPAGKPPGRREGAHRPGRRTKAGQLNTKAGLEMTEKGTARLHATVYPRTRIKRAESEREQEAARSSAHPAKLAGPAKSRPTARSEPRAGLKPCGV